MPPPKKKWLQEYKAIEQVSLSDSKSASLITENLSTEAREFVRLFDNGTDQMINNNLKQLSENSSVKGKIQLSQEVIGGVVQGVLDQFQSFFEAGCPPSPSQTFKIETPSSEEQQKLSPSFVNSIKNGNKTVQEQVKLICVTGEEKKEGGNEGNQLGHEDFTPVVQSVISQFLNGSLADADFRRSRKRSHKHINCSHKGGEGWGGSSSHRVKRSNSVIQFKSRDQGLNQPPSSSSPLASKHRDISRVKPEPQLGQVHDENEALNLSLPKPVAKVTFASRDRCYTTDSPAIKTFQTSKSEELSCQENSQSCSNDSRLDLPSSPSRFSLPVIRHTSSPHPEAALDMALGSLDMSQTHRRCDGPIFLPPPPSSVPSSRLHPPPTSTQASSGSSLYPPVHSSPPPSLEGLQKAEQISSTPHSTFSYPVIKPRAIQPLLEPSSTLHTPQFTLSFPTPSSNSGESNCKPVNSLASRATRERHENLSKEEIKRTSSSTREVHNRLEKNRRAHLKMCFDELAIECNLDPKKTSNLTVIQSAYKFTMSLKRKDRENERNLASLVQQKIKLQQRLEEIKRELPGMESESDGE